MLDTKNQEYLLNLMGYFIRKGKKTTSEGLFRKYITNKFITNKRNLYAELKTCKYRTTKYLHINEKKRGRRSKYRIQTLRSKRVGEKVGVVLVGRSAYLNTKKSPKQFATLFNQDISNWNTGKHLLKQKYKEPSIMAKRYGPKFWFRSKEQVERIFKRTERLNFLRAKRAKISRLNGGISSLKKKMSYWKRILYKIKSKKMFKKSGKPNKYFYKIQKRKRKAKRVKRRLQRRKKWSERRAVFKAKAASKKAVRAKKMKNIKKNVNKNFKKFFVKH